MGLRSSGRDDVFEEGLSITGLLRFPPRPFGVKLINSTPTRAFLALSILDGGRIVCAYHAAATSRRSTLFIRRS